MTKSNEAFRTIAEVAEELDVAKHVLRFWEVKFPQIKPMKRGGGRRFYRPEDMELLRGVRNLLHSEGYTIKGVQKILREQGVDAVKAFASDVGGRNKGRSSREKTSRDVAEGLVGRAGGAGPGKGSAGAAGAQRLPARQAARAGAGASSRDEIIAAAIRELEACRLLLGGGAPPSRREDSGAVAPGRRSR